VGPACRAATIRAQTESGEGDALEEGKGVECETDVAEVEDVGERAVVGR